jgi:hypothetical protein
MFILALLKIKNFLFGNLSSIFVVGLIAIIAMLALFNADAVLSKMGMETRSTLTAKLAKTEEQLKVVVAKNAELSSSIDKLQKDGNFRTTVVEENCKEAMVINDKVDASTSTLDQKATVIKRGPKKIAKVNQIHTPTADVQPIDSATAESDTAVVLKMTNQLSPDQLNALSQSNITAINSSYADLFTKV